MELCHLDGRILPLAEARIHPLDRGFVFGDALYEAFKIQGGAVLHLAPHLGRLADGLARIEIPWPDGLEESIHRLLAVSEVAEGSLYLQISRGVAPRSHYPPQGLRPTVFMVPRAHGFDPPGSREMRAITLPDWRWRNCDVKSTSLMATVMGKLAARNAAADEVIFVAADGGLREGGSTNVIAVEDGVLVTHPLDGRVLPGVTRQLLLELAARDGVEIAQRAPRLAERAGWDELFVTGTLTGVQGVVSLDGEAVGDGRVGPLTRRLGGLFAAFEEALASARRPSPDVGGRP